MTKKLLKAAGPSRLRSRWHTVPWAISNAPFGTELSSYISSLHAQVMWIPETRRIQQFYPVLILKPQFQLCSIQINRLIRYFNNASSTEKVIKLSYYYVWQCWSVVCIATGYVLGRGVGVWAPVGSRIFSSPRRPDRLWGPPSLLSNGYQGLFPRG
jgi:hypothetical protein